MLAGKMVQPGFHVFVAEDLQLLRPARPIRDPKLLPLIVAKPQAPLATVDDVASHLTHVVDKRAHLQRHQQTPGG